MEEASKNQAGSLDAIMDARGLSLVDIAILLRMGVLEEQKNDGLEYTVLLYDPSELDRAVGMLEYLRS